VSARRGSPSRWNHARETQLASATRPVYLDAPVLDLRQLPSLSIISSSPRLLSSSFPPVAPPHQRVRNSPPLPQRARRVSLPREASAASRSTPAAPRRPPGFQTKESAGAALPAPHHHRLKNSPLPTTSTTHTAARPIATRVPTPRVGQRSVPRFSAPVQRRPYVRRSSLLLPSTAPPTKPPPGRPPSHPRRSNPTTQYHPRSSAQSAVQQGRTRAALRAPCPPRPLPSARGRSRGVGSPRALRSLALPAAPPPPHTHARRETLSSQVRYFRSGDSQVTPL
jgi:hypothetical protein